MNRDREGGLHSEAVSGSQRRDATKAKRKALWSNGLVTAVGSNRATLGSRELSGVYPTRTSAETGDHHVVLGYRRMGDGHPSSRRQVFKVWVRSGTAN